MAQVEEIQEHSHRNRRRKMMFFICRRLGKLLLIVLPYFRYYFDLLVDQIFGLYYDSRIEKVQKPSDDIVLKSAVFLASEIRQGNLKSEDVVRAFIQRIKEVNPTLNAIVDECFHDAIKEARRVDKDIASGAILESEFAAKPFLGIPFTTKESTAVKGLSSTYGLLNRKGRRAVFDAEVVTRLKNAGGIIIGVTNIPQLNMWQETRNPVYGLTRNPYNTTRNVGGSSGGEASIIAACGSPIGIGSDIGGSLRIPAFMCGICAHKPTSNLLSTHGLTFRTGKETKTMVVPGPMSKYIDDIIPLLKVLLGENVSKLRLDEKVDIKNIKVYYVIDPKDPFVSPIRSEMKKMLSKIIEHFNEILLYKPELVDIEELRYGGRIWKYWMTQEPNFNFNRDITDRQGEVNSIFELIKFCFGRSEYNIAAIMYLLNGILPEVNAEWAKEITNTLREKLMDILDDDGILLYPSAPWPASYHHTALLRPWNLNLFAIWNALKFPVTQVPMGLNKEGLPLGIQVVAAPYQDHLAIAVARELEKTFGGYVPPFSLDKKSV